MDVTQTTDIADSAGTVKGVEYRRKGGQRIGSGAQHFTHYIDLDGAGIAEGNLDIVAGVCINFAEFLFQDSLRFGYAHAVQQDKAQIGNIDVTVRRNGFADGVLAGSPDVDDYFITRTETVVGRSGHVHIGFEGQIFGVEDVTAEYLVFGVIVVKGSQ